MFHLTTATRKVERLTKKIRAVQGGTSASKTISIEMVLIALSQHDETPKLTSIVSESLPHLKRGALRDFKNIMKTQGYWEDKRWHDTDKIYTFPSKKDPTKDGSQIEFFGVEDADKLRGGRRDRLFMNECNNCTLAAFDQLEVRTRECVYLDWNPSAEFWFNTDVCSCQREECIGDRTDVEHITLTYKDNEALEESIVSSIEMRKNRKGWYMVFGMGQLGEVEGKIYNGWIILPEVPKEARLARRGLDFGYSVDPTAIVDVYKYNGGIVLDEVTYETGLTNPSIAKLLKNMEPTLIIADSAEPKSIDELKLYGVQTQPCSKGPGSVRQGIQVLQEQTVYVTKASVNLIKEYRNYLWAYDRQGKIISPNEPEDSDDHALDAARYAVQTMNFAAPMQHPTIQTGGVESLYSELGLV